MEISIYSREGGKVASMDVSDHLFARKNNPALIQQAVHNELANNRIGTASTKMRGEVRGSKSKPWNQKGTGRARAGSRRSPLWTGGGVVFGPRPRSYSYSMSRQQKRLALLVILSQKIREDRFKIVDDISLENGRTGELAKLLSNIATSRRVVIILSDEDHLIKRASRNIPWLNYLCYTRLRAFDLLYSHQIILSKSTISAMDSFYSNIVKNRVTNGSV